MMGITDIDDKIIRRSEEVGLNHFCVLPWKSEKFGHPKFTVNILMSPPAVCVEEKNSAQFYLQIKYNIYMRGTH